MRKSAVFDVQFSQAEFKLLEKCVASCVPLLVCEYDSQNWFVCPTCHSTIDHDYAAYCECCGQKLSWYGSVSHAHRVGEEPVIRKSTHHTTTPPVISATEDQSRAIQSEINLLKEKINEKRSALKKLETAQEEKKKERLMKALSISGKSVDDLIDLLEKLEA